MFLLHELQLRQKLEAPLQAILRIKYPTTTCHRMRGGWKKQQLQYLFLSLDSVRLGVVALGHDHASHDTKNRIFGTKSIPFWQSGSLPDHDYSLDEIRDQNLAILSSHITT